MPTRRLTDTPNGWVRPPEICHSSDHRPPMHQVFEPGNYVHECSACGKETYFRVPAITCEVKL